MYLPGAGCLMPAILKESQNILKAIFNWIYLLLWRVSVRWWFKNESICNNTPQNYHQKLCRRAPVPLQWRHNERDDVSNHQPHDCVLKRLFMRRSKKTSELRVIGLCKGNSPVPGEFPAQRASNAENVSIWWRHHSDAVRVDQRTSRLKFL